MASVGPSALNEMSGACLAVRARMVARTLSAIYDRAMAGQGATISQVNIMVFVGRRGGCTPGEIGRWLAMERSTVSRNVRPLLANGWLAGEVGDGGRLRLVRLTAPGRRKVESLLPSWRRAQARAALLLGEAGSRSVRDLGDRLWAGQSATDAGCS